MQANESMQVTSSERVEKGLHRGRGGGVSRILGEEKENIKRE
jgi:hypothetical protein